MYLNTYDSNMALHKADESKNEITSVSVRDNVGSECGRFFAANNFQHDRRFSESRFLTLVSWTLQIPLLASVTDLLR